jgi:6-pyruvoyl-tetrahydropterin synthase
MIEISGGPFQFSAAHSGLHDGQFEPLHGHTCTPSLRLHGQVAGSGMLTDFRLVKDALREAIAPLRCRTEDGQVFIECGATRFSLPTGHVVVNTTTEAIADWLLGRLLPRLTGETGLTRVDQVTGMATTEMSATASSSGCGYAGSGLAVTASGKTAEFLRSENSNGCEKVLVGPVIPGVSCGIGLACYNTQLTAAKMGWGIRGRTRTGWRGAACRRRTRPI